MSRFWIAFLVGAVCAALAACGASPSATSTLMPSLSPAVTLSPQPSETVSPTTQPTVRASALPSPTGTPTALPTYLARQITPFPMPQAVISVGNSTMLRELARWGRARPQQIDYSSSGAWLVVKNALESTVFSAALPERGQMLPGGVQVAPGEQSAYSLTADGGLDLWQVEGWRRLGHWAARRAVFSPRGDWLAAASADAVLLIDAGGNTRQSLAQTAVEQLRFSPDGAWLACAGQDGLQVWPVGGESSIMKIAYERTLRLEWAQGGKLLVAQARTAQGEQVVEVYRTADWSLSASLPAAGTLALAPDGTRLYVYSNFPTLGRVSLYSLPDGKALGEFRAGGSLYRLSVSPDSRLLAASIVDFSASNQQTVGYVKLFDAQGKTLHQLDCGIFCEAQTPVFSPDSKLLALAGVTSANGIYVGSTFLFETAGGARLRALRGAQVVTGSVEQIVFSPGGETLASLTGATDDAVRIWKTADGALLHTLEWNAQTLSLGDLDARKGLLAAYSDTGQTSLLRVQDGAVQKTFERAVDPRFSPNGEWLAAGDFQSRRPAGLRLLRSGDGAPLSTLSQNQGGPLIFAPAGDMGILLNGFSAQSVKLPGGGFGGAFNATARPNVQLTCGAFAPDGRLFAAGSAQGEVWLWALPNEKPPLMLEGHQNSVAALAFTGDGAHLLSLSTDGLLNVWSLNDGKLVKNIPLRALLRAWLQNEDTNLGEMAALAISPDGNLAAAGGIINPLQFAPARAAVTLLIDVQSAAVLRVLPGGGGRMAFSAAGTLLFTSGDGAIHTWGVRP